MARGSRVGNKNNLESPFSNTGYTNKLIRDRNARSVGDVLQNDPTVRIARGFGNFQESYFIRGFASESDDTMYNGLYGILPRQYIATELFERVEVQRGASAFLNGMAPGGNNIGGTVSVLPKRAPNEDLTSVTASYGAGRRGGLDAVPAAPKASSNWAQPWSYSNEREWFGTLRGEYDFTDTLTGYAAYGFRRGNEHNSLANLTVNNLNGDGSQYRFDNVRRDKTDTGEIGLRGRFDTGPVQHEWALAANRFQSERKNAYIMDFGNSFSTNLYRPVRRPPPAALNPMFSGNDMGAPALTGRLRLSSIAFGDTLNLFDKRLQIMLGARWQKIHSETFAYGSRQKSADYKKSRISPAVGIVYRITPAWSVYGNYIESLSQGATAGSTTSIGGTVYRVSNADEMLKPFVSKQKEIGTKFERNGFGAGLALFSTDKPRSLYTITDPLNRTARLTAEGKDRHRGAELTVYGEAAPGLRLLGGITLLDAKQKSTGSSTTDGKRTIGTAIVSQNKKDTRQRAVDSTSSTARRANAVYFLFWLTIKPKPTSVWNGKSPK